MTRLWPFLLAATLTVGDAAAQNRVLELCDRGDYVELPSDLFLDFEEATVEAWVRWDKFGHYTQWFAFGSGSQFQSMGLNQVGRLRAFQFFIYDRDRVPHVARVAANLPAGEWIHMAAVSGPGGMRLYLNGIVSAFDDFTGSFAAMGNGEASYLGRSNWPDNLDRQGSGRSGFARRHERQARCVVEALSDRLDPPSLLYVGDLRTW